ncbi:MAG TPA: PASTA domain-containing protein, partial [Candidatus Latescibacteria bacterium]|nr:PASTA domain-containing protein [Candidatus Latescibacterota bacterium]
MSNCKRKLHGQIFALMTFLGVSGIVSAQTTTMPNVVGMDIASATAAVKGTIARFATLYVEPTDDPAAVGKIDGQYPTEGSTLSSSTVVTLTARRANTPGLLTL